MRSTPAWFVWLAGASVVWAMTPFKPPVIRKPAVKIGPPKVAKGDAPTFESEGYALVLAKLEARSEVDLAERGGRNHTIKLEGRIVAPEDQDAVAVTTDLDVVSVTDAEEASLKEIKRTLGTGGAITVNRPAEYKTDTYGAFHDHQAKVEVPTVDLRRSAYTIRKMELKATVVLAEQREEKALPAVVMERPEELLPGLRIRITSLKLSANGQLALSAECQKPAGGPVGPFVEQVWVLDEKDERIAGGRWTRGDPFAKSERLTAELDLSKGTPHKSVLFVICTKHARKPLAFAVEGIFQK